MTSDIDRGALDADEARLLHTFADGPRIWDAASVFNVVLRLESKGLVTPVGEGSAYALTANGRTMLSQIGGN